MTNPPPHNTKWRRAMDEYWNAYWKRRTEVIEERFKNIRVEELPAKPAKKGEE
jgi:hypothetical protein